MFKVENGNTIFVPQALRYSPNFVRRVPIRSKVKNRDISQIGGERLKPLNNSYTRLFSDVVSGMTTATYASLDGFVDVTRPFLPVGNNSLDLMSLQQAINSMTETSTNGVYSSIIVDLDVEYLPPITPGEVIRMQEALRPPTEMSDAQVIASPLVAARIAEAEATDGMSFDIVASIFSDKCNNDEKFKVYLKGISDDASVAGDDLVEVTANEVRAANISTFTMAIGHVGEALKEAINAHAIEAVRLLKIIDTGLGERVILTAPFLSDAVATTRAEHRVASFLTPGFLGSEDWEGIKDSTYLRRTRATKIKHVFFDLRKPGDRGVPNAAAPSLMNLPDEVHEDIADALSAEMHAAAMESARLDGLVFEAGAAPLARVTVFPRSRFTTEAQSNAKRDEDTDHALVDNRNLDDAKTQASAFFPPGIACVGMIVREIVYRGEEFIDEEFNMTHLVLSVGNAEQVLDENEKMLYGFVRATNIVDGLYRDPGVSYHNFIVERSSFAIDFESWQNYDQLYGNAEVVEMVRLGTLVGYLKGGHHSTTANMSNTLDRMVGGIGCNMESFDTTPATVFNLIMQHGMHTSSLRLMFALLLRDAAEGKISNAVKIRLNPDGPLLSGPRNLHRAFTQIVGAGYFSIMNNTETPARVDAAMVRINEVGYRFVPYAQFMYGVSQPSPEGALQTMQEAAIYAAAFKKAVPGSTIGRSLALTRMAEQAESNDILVQLRVHGFVKAYKGFVGAHVTKQLRGHLGLSGANALELLD